MNFQINGETLVIDTTRHYGNGATAVVVATPEGESFATLSVNLPESASLPPDTFYLKTWSENEDVSKAAIDAGVIEPANPFLVPPVRSGFVTARAYTIKEVAA